MRSIEPPINTVFQGLRGIVNGKGKNSSQKRLGKENKHKYLKNEVKIG